MTRILSYNILAGGYNLREGGSKRVKQLASIIRAAQPDVVGLVEATNSQIKQRPTVIEELAELLDMQLIVSDNAMEQKDFQVALLTRLPIIYTKIHANANLIKPLLEVCVEETNGEQLTAFVTHLPAAFSSTLSGEVLRRREIREVLRIVAAKQDTPHVLMGDFNSLTPGDAFKASFLLRYMVNLDDHYKPKHAVTSTDGHPYLDGVVPPALRFLTPILRVIPQNPIFASVFDMAASLCAPRLTINQVRNAGYVDCFRRINPNARGFTCPAASPAGRIDYIFASPVLARRLSDCQVMFEGEEGLRGYQASDHLAVCAEFGEAVEAIELASDHRSFQLTGEKELLANGVQ